MMKRARATARLLVAVVIACGVLAPAAAAQAGAQHSLRSPVTDENFYFVMADRFENGSTANDLGGLPRRPPGLRLRPDGARASTTAATCAGIIRRLDYIEGLGTTVDLADAELQEPGRAAAVTPTASPRPATTATGSRTSRRSTRTSAPTRTSPSSSPPRTSAA